jgi:GTP cyclohydrolase I
MDREAAERAVAQFLAALGHDVESDPELSGTPARVVDAFANDLLAGANVDIAQLVAGGSMPTSADHGLVAVRDIAVATLCPHHLLPALGRATVAYQPGPRLLGLGTLAALVDAFSRRLTLQEAISHNVVQALMQHAQARGAWCRIELRHSCLSARGARQSEALVESVASSGTLAAPGAVADLSAPGSGRPGA